MIDNSFEKYLENTRPVDATERECVGLTDEIDEFAGLKFNMAKKFNTVAYIANPDAVKLTTTPRDRFYDGLPPVKDTKFFGLPIESDERVKQEPHTEEDRFENEI